MLHKICNGEQSLSFDVNNNREAEQSLDTIFRDLAGQPQRIAIAINGGIDNPTSKEFLSEYNLGAASSVSQAIKSLVEKEFVFYSGERYRIMMCSFHDGLFINRNNHGLWPMA